MYWNNDKYYPQISSEELKKRFGHESTERGDHEVCKSGGTNKYVLVIFSLDMVLISKLNSELKRLAFATYIYIYIVCNAPKDSLK